MSRVHGLKCPLSGILCEECGYPKDSCFLDDIITSLDSLIEKMSKEE